MEVIFISGPMRGHPEFNFPLFFEVEKMLKEKYPQAEIFNPAQKDLDMGFKPWGKKGNENITELGLSLREAMAADLEFLAKKATKIYLLPRWQTSSGAKVEIALAKLLNLEFIFHS